MDKVRKILAFLAIYIIWGSTYLAIRYGIETIPPLSLSAARYLIAGVIMLAGALCVKEKRLNRDELQICLLSGVLLIGANGVVCFVEGLLPSGLCAVVIGTMPAWILIMSWLLFQGVRPSLLKLAGSGVACLGIVLIGIDSGHSLEGSSYLGFAYLALSCLLWSLGTLMQRKVMTMRSPLLFSALQMLAGSVVTMGASAIVEHPWQHDWSKVTSSSLWALAYLVVFGSLIAFTAYSWLSRNVPAYLVSTYALVNPVIAVLLGSLFYREPITPSFLLATGIILVGLILLLVKPRAAVTPKLAK